LRLIQIHFLFCSNLALVRADVSRLPFESGSVDAVHAGAALHCWPSPSNAVSNVSQFYENRNLWVEGKLFKMTNFCLLACLLKS